LIYSQRRTLVAMPQSADCLPFFKYPWSPHIVETRNLTHI